MFHSTKQHMRPDAHLTRVRKKLPGYHNRRYKGKNRPIDRKRTLEERKVAAQRRLPLLVRWRLAELEAQAPGHLLIEVVSEVLETFCPHDNLQVWLQEDRLYLVLKGIYVEMELCEEGFLADCFTDQDEEIYTHYHPLCVAFWLRSVVKKR